MTQTPIDKNKINFSKKLNLSKLPLAWQALTRFLRSSALPKCPFISYMFLAQYPIQILGRKKELEQ
jgi:hypothetical protein